MNARIKAVLDPLYPAPLEYQARVRMHHIRADNEAEFDRRRADLFAEFAAQADAIRADYDNMNAAEFLAKHGAK